MISLRFITNHYVYDFTVTICFVSSSVFLLLQHADSGRQQQEENLREM